jgi:hypothetical protein
LTRDGFNDVRYFLLPVFDLEIDIDLLGIGQHGVDRKIVDCERARRSDADCGGETTKSFGASRIER